MDEKLCDFLENEKLRIFLGTTKHKIFEYFSDFWLSHASLLALWKLISMQATFIFSSNLNLFKEIPFRRWHNVDDDGLRLAQDDCVLLFDSDFDQRRVECEHRKYIHKNLWLVFTFSHLHRQQRREDDKKLKFSESEKKFVYKKFHSCLCPDLEQFRLVMTVKMLKLWVFSV